MLLRPEPLPQRGGRKVSLDAIDFFCGMGGSTTGLVDAGIEVKLAANHWDRAIETHSANHPDTEHLCADLQNVDLRYLPKTRILWASPICTEVSPAGGRKRRDANPSLFEDHGHVPAAAFERTRVTFWEVIRAVELFRHDIVLIENVAEAAAWELFDTWLAGMRTLGYNAQFVSVSAAHVGDPDNVPAPQWRDRMYIVFNRNGVPAPDVEPLPLALCERCDANVQAIQWWKPHGLPPARRIGKYNQQYHYVCPAGHGRVEPYVMPAAAAIDWTDIGTRIGDRKRPLAERTMRRIQQGLDMVASGAFGFTMAHGGKAVPYNLLADPMRTWTTGDTEAMALAPFMAAAAGNTWDAAASGKGGYYRLHDTASPMPTQTTTVELGLVTPFVMGGAGEQRSTAIADPMRTQRASGADFLATPFLSMLRNNGDNLPVTEPAPTFTASGYHHGLVIPFRKGDSPFRADSEPLTTMATRDQHGVIPQPALNLEDAHFRMLRPREAANAQRFPRSYIIHGNQGEQQMQAGNAVAVNVAHWLGKQVVAALDSRAAKPRHDLPPLQRQRTHRPRPPR